MLHALATILIILIVVGAAIYILNLIINAVPMSPPIKQLANTVITIMVVIVIALVAIWAIRLLLGGGPITIP